MELHALAQLEAPGGGRGGFPAGGEHRRQRKIAVAANQRLVDIAQKSELERLLQRMRVHRHRVALVGDFERVGAGAQAQGGGGDDRQSAGLGKQCCREGLGRVHGFVSVILEWRMQGVYSGSASMARLASSAAPSGRISSLKS